jgi:hypothetical protein
MSAPVLRFTNPRSVQDEHPVVAKVRLLAEHHTRSADVIDMLASDLLIQRGISYRRGRSMASGATQFDRISRKLAALTSRSAGATAVVEELIDQIFLELDGDPKGGA